jgi:hypothetical protein
MALSVLPRGGGDGDAIRMGILNIMREHGIREGHRPVTSLCRRFHPSYARPVEWLTTLKCLRRKLGVEYGLIWFGMVWYGTPIG